MQYGGSSTTPIGGFPAAESVNIRDQSPHATFTADIRLANAHSTSARSSSSICVMPLPFRADIMGNLAGPGLPRRSSLLHSPSPHQIPEHQHHQPAICALYHVASIRSLQRRDLAHWQSQQLCPLPSQTPASHRWRASRSISFGGDPVIHPATARQSAFTARQKFVT